MSRFYAHRVMEAAGTVSALPMGNKSQITSERQARELARVEPACRFTAGGLFCGPVVGDLWTKTTLPP